MRRLGILLLLACFACTDPFEEAKKIDTIEAWEAYISSGGSGRQKIEAEGRLEELMLEKARASKSLADYDALIARFPKGKQAKETNKERQTLYFQQIENENTAEGWQRFLDEYPRPKGDSALIADARRRLEVAKNADRFEIGQVEIAQVNLAEDPKGPLDGWGFKVPVTNKGDQPIESMYLRILLLDDSGKELIRREWPVVAKRMPGGLGMPDGFDKPMAPGETRVWDFTTGDAPEGWNQKVKVYANRIKLVGATEAAGEGKGEEKAEDAAGGE